MFVSEVWSRILKLFGILFIGVEIFLGVCLFDVTSTVTANSKYIKENPNQFILDVSLDKEGVHKDGKTYQMASEGSIFWVASSDKCAYDVRNFCAFQPYPKKYIYIGISGMTVLALMTCLIYRRKRVWYIELLVLAVTAGIALLAI